MVLAHKWCCEHTDEVRNKEDTKTMMKMMMENNGALLVLLVCGVM